MILKKRYIDKKVVVTTFDDCEEIITTIKVECNTIVIRKDRVDIFFLGQYDSSFEIPNPITIRGDKREEGTEIVLELPMFKINLNNEPLLCNSYGHVISKNNVVFDKYLLFREIKRNKMLNTE